MHCPPLPLRVVAVALLALLLAPGCASTDDSQLEEVDVFQPLGPDSRLDDSIGKYLADLSTSMNAWMNKTMDAATQQERSKHALLETSIRERVRKRKSEILTQLETGPTRNRVIAATALGFSNDPTMLSPLLACLDDPDELVVSNALTGLAVLGLPETPLGRVAELMRYAEDPKTRWSAANCARTLIEAGADGLPVLTSARAGLAEVAEPMVRTQCLLILARLEDAESIDAMSQLLYDDTPLVGVAAARSLAYLGRHVDKAKGDVARALFAALAEGDREQRIVAHRGLVELSGRDYKLDVEEWREWVLRQP
ncbi:MAG: HEAT repeat domain-containing protein [Planctomycetes bacterium]|nr:HEAT repeat domain-containing protein [Planctomycetota bacterium]